MAIDRKKGSSSDLGQVSMSLRERFRSPSEILAKYNLGREKYKKLKANSNTDRIHLQTLYAELKALGWVMGRDEQKVIMEILN